MNRKLELPEARSETSSAEARQGDARSVSDLGTRSAVDRAVPAKECVWCDEPASSHRSGECLGYGAQHRPIIIVERPPVVLAAEHTELVA